MNTVFVVQHLHRLPNEEDDVKFIGVYRTRSSAEKAASRLSLLPGFSKHPHVVDNENGEDDQGFHINEYQLDKDHWVDGFVTMPD